jgi:PleD family two-component response regulator
VAHNSIQRQECFTTGRMRKARNPNRNWTCMRTQVTPIGPGGFSGANEARTASSVPLRAVAGFATHNPVEPCRVLIVDDDDIVISRLSFLLEGTGYQVCAASSGADAMRILNSVTCQIVITDWHMPDMSGLELCRDIRSRADKAHIYVLMLTVRSGSGDILAALSAGADDYVVKGASAEEILARLEVGRRIT